jgi:2-succinyl-5-enolpyruvyl-6-hydroxy-3-cyclohexene-1-carboxylate synthase
MNCRTAVAGTIFFLLTGTAFADDAASYSSKRVEQHLRYVRATKEALNEATSATARGAPAVEVCSHLAVAFLANSQAIRDMEAVRHDKRLLPIYRDRLLARSSTLPNVRDVIRGLQSRNKCLEP